MEYRMRVIVFAVIGLAVVFGLWPGNGGPDAGFNSAPLHIFLFNLAAGGLALITRYRDRDRLDWFGAMYLILAGVFALAASVNLPGAVFFSALAMFVMAESVRWKRFSWFPHEFFTAAPVWRKFEQAALLCLSLGLFICAGAVFGLHFLQFALPPKLDLHIFFLGFSFPLSLIFFSHIFRRLADAPAPPGRLASEVCFWFLNLGVIVFFFAIIFENFAGQMAMALTLFSVVLITGSFHLTRARRDPGWAWVSSGLGFLVVGSVTGIVYVGVLWADSEYGSAARYLLGFHAAATVFGWNLGWVLLAAAPDGNANMRPRIWLHWTLVVLLPAGKVSPVLALAAGLIGILFLDRVLLAGRPGPR